MHNTGRRTIAVLVALTMTAGCATIVNHPTQAIGFSSRPAGASVTVDGIVQGQTPLVKKLSRKNNHLVSFELEGYEPFKASLVPEVSGWVWGNIVLGGLIGLAIDAGTGSMYKLTPDQVAAELQKKNQFFELRQVRLYPQEWRFLALNIKERFDTFPKKENLK